MGKAEPCMATIRDGAALALIEKPGLRHPGCRRRCQVEAEIGYKLPIENERRVVRYAHRFDGLGHGALGSALRCRNRHFSAAFMRSDSFKREFGRQERCGFCESGRLFMATAKSRTYRLHLSEEGTDAFLEFHSRLARIVRRFIPYGATLTVAMLLIEAWTFRSYPMNFSPWL